jgi:hypothetical protein
MDGLHARGQLPGERARYIVVADPPGPRVGSGGRAWQTLLAT